MKVFNFYRIIAVILTTLLFSFDLKAQEVREGADSLQIARPDLVILTEGEPSLVMSYYTDDLDALTRTYDYELLNKTRRIEMSSKRVVTYGYITVLGIIAVGSVLAVNNDWNLWWVIPAGTAVCVGTMVGFAAWSRKIQARADAIELAPMYSYQINDNISVSAMGGTTGGFSSMEFGVGIGFTAKF